MNRTDDKGGQYTPFGLPDRATARPLPPALCAMSRSFQICTFVFLMLATHQVSADACLERMVTPINPIFPRIFCGSRSVEDVKHCFVVRLSYGLSETGKTQNIKALDENESCVAFSRSVEKALTKTEFFPGSEEESCIYEVTFELEPYEPGKP